MTTTVIICLSAITACSLTIAATQTYRLSRFRRNTSEILKRLYKTYDKCIHHSDPLIRKGVSEVVGLIAIDIHDTLHRS